MGGNVSVKYKGKEYRAQKIPIKDIGRSNFTKKFIDIFKKINSLYYKKYGEHLWKKEENIKNGLQFNGSTSYIFSTDYSDSEIELYKGSAGDLDIIVPENSKEKLFKFLKSIEGKEILKGVVYLGSNKPTLSSVGEQINSLFSVDFSGKKIYAQVDFEFLPMEEDGATPTEWAKFSHSSSFEDQKKGIKALHHKYLIRALVGGASIRDDVIIVTPSANAQNWMKKQKKFKPGDLPRFLKFSVSRGIRTAYEPLLDEDGNQIIYDGKEVWREIPSKSSSYTNIVKEIAKLAFGNPEDIDVEKFTSFTGVIDLMKKYLNKQQIKRTFDRYETLLWGPGAQVIERGNPKGDYEVKYPGYEYFIKTFGFKPNDKLIDEYYKNFKDNERKSESLIRKVLIGEFYV